MPGSLITNFGAQIQTGIENRLNQLSLLELERYIAAYERQKRPLRGCVNSDAVGGGRETVCE